MAAIELSICIPTHHGRAEKLGAAIESIVDQVPARLADEVEIIVSDNASRDGTDEMVAQAAAAAAITISYSRVDEDRGAATNLRRCVELARGRWCWLLGSDDAVAPGGVARALTLLAENPHAAGFTVNRMAYDAELGHALAEPHPWIVPPAAPGAEVLRSMSQVFDRVGLLLGNMSCQIVEKALWSQAISWIGHDHLVRGRSVAHVALIGAMLAERPVWIWCSEVLVWQRTGTAELGPFGGSVARFMVEVSADLAYVWANVAGLRRPTRRKLLERWRREVARPVIISQMRRHESYHRIDDLRLLVGYARLFGRLPGFWRETAPALLRLAVTNRF